MRGNLLWNLVRICSKILSGNAYKVKDFYNLVTREKYEASVSLARGQPRKTWNEVTRRDLKGSKRNKELTNDRYT